MIRVVDYAVTVPVCTEPIYTHVNCYRAQRGVYKAKCDTVIRGYRCSAIGCFFACGWITSLMDPHRDPRLLSCRY